MLIQILNLIFCHFVGDYVLQSNYLATTKGKDSYNLLVHCILYCLPFYICFGLNCSLLCIFIAHIIIDTLKAKYNKLTIMQDQILHFLIMGVYFVN